MWFIFHILCLPIFFSIFLIVWHLANSNLNPTWLQAFLCLLFPPAYLSVSSEFLGSLREFTFKILQICLYWYMMCIYFLFSAQKNTLCTMMVSAWSSFVSPDHVVNCCHVFILCCYFVRFVSDSFVSWISLQWRVSGIYCPVVSPSCIVVLCLLYLLFRVLFLTSLVYVMLGELSVHHLEPTCHLMCRSLTHQVALPSVILMGIGYKSECQESQLNPLIAPYSLHSSWRWLTRVPFKLWSWTECYLLSIKLTYFYRVISAYVWDQSLLLSLFPLSVKV